MYKIASKFVNVRPFDNTSFVVSGNVGIPQTSLITPVWWLSILQLVVLRRSVNVVLSNEVFGGVFVFSHCFFPVGVEALIIGLSRVSSIFS